MPPNLTAEIRRLQAQIDALSSGSLVPTPNDGSNLAKSDTINAPFDGLHHRVTWTGYSGFPSWGSVSGGTLSIVEPGLYVSAPCYQIGALPTTSGLVVLVGVPFLLMFQQNVDDIASSFPPAMETSILASSDLPWIPLWDVITPHDATGSLNVFINVQQLASVS